jgi:uncharacterized LabA/DUF88 family protein
LEFRNTRTQQVYEYLDADFERPLELLRARGKKFLILSTPGSVAREIRAVAGMHFVDFQDLRSEVEKPQ